VPDQAWDGKEIAPDYDDQDVLPRDKPTGAVDGVDPDVFDTDDLAGQINELSLADQVTEKNIAECADFFLIDMHTMRDNSTKVKLPGMRPGEGIYTFQLFVVWWRAAGTVSPGDPNFDPAVNHGSTYHAWLADPELRRYNYQRLERIGRVYTEVVNTHFDDIQHDPRALSDWNNKKTQGSCRDPRRRLQRTTSMEACFSVFKML